MFMILETARMYASYMLFGRINVGSVSKPELLELRDLSVLIHKCMQRTYKLLLIALLVGLALQPSAFIGCVIGILISIPWENTAFKVRMGQLEPEIARRAAPDACI